MDPQEPSNSSASLGPVNSAAGEASASGSSTSASAPMPSVAGAGVPSPAATASPVIDAEPWVQPASAPAVVAASATEATASAVASVPSPAEPLPPVGPIGSAPAAAQPPQAEGAQPPSFGPMPSAPVTPSQAAPTTGGGFSGDAAASGVVSGGMPVSTMPKKSAKGAIIGMVIGAVGLVLLLVLGLVYYKVANSPQRILDAALASSLSGKGYQTVSFDGAVQVKPKDGQTLHSTFSGSVDQNGAFSLSASIDALITNLTFDARSADGNTFYLKVGGLSGLPELLQQSGDSTAMQVAPIISGLNDQWIEVNQSMIKQLTGSELHLGSKLSAADQKKIADAYKKYEFMHAVKSLGQEDIKGKKSHHYQVAIDGTKLKGFMTALKAANIPGVSIDTSSLTMFNTAIDNAHLADHPFDMWVANDTKLIDQIVVSVSSNGNAVSARYTVDSYNQPVHVDVPANAKSLLDVISQLMQTVPGLSGGLGSLGMSSQDMGGMNMSL